eukprot:jgi/Chlat1/4239/Chrsp27S04250
MASLVVVLGGVDLLAVGAVGPLITPIARELGATPSQVGALSSLYGALQLLSATPAGWVSDRLGRKTLLAAAYLGAALGYALLAVAGSGYGWPLGWLALSRVVTGLCKHSSDAAKAIVSDQTKPELRSTALGRLATATGVGIMIGPTLGSLLFRSGGAALPAMFASLVFVCLAAVAFVQLPHVKPAEHHDEKLHPPTPGGLFKQGSQKALWVLSVRAFISMGVMVFREFFSLLLAYRFTLGVQARLATGYLISFQGLLSALVQGLAIRPLTRMLPDDQLLRYSLTMLAAAFAACALSPSVTILVLCLIPVALAGGVARTAYSSILTQTVPSAQVGRVLGMAGTVSSVCRIVAPALAGSVSTYYGTSAAGLCSGALVLMGAAMFSHVQRTHLVPRSSPPEREPLLKDGVDVDGIPHDYVKSRRRS